MMNQFYKAFREGGMNPLGRLAGVKKSIFTLAVMLLTSLSMTVIAQDVTVSGTVKGTDGTGLPGVTVQAKGTTKGTQTNIDGTYKLAGIAKNATLIFSFVGMETQEVAVGNRSVVDVVLKDDSKALEEVVVVGYGTVKKKDATGAVSAIGAKDFNQGIVTSPEQLMQGRVAGVAITQNNGEPGGAINIRIRGTTSVNSGTQPLFVIDGVPLTDDGSTAGGNASGLGNTTARNPLNFLNPDDIASIDILKDASATAIYGSRGANGVVLVTTKKGKGGSKGGLEYSVSTGFSSITKRYDLLTADAFKAAGGFNEGGSTDWQKEAFRTGITQQHNLAYGGGDASGNYRVSFGYLDQQGIVKNSSIKRYSGGFNGNKKFINNRLTIGVNLTVANTSN
jgi:TonB-dependent starch-binding outer membrane protein SusC